MATIREIAKRANVSIATVSRVLNNHASVNEALRYTVLQAAAELGYALDSARTKPQIGPTVLVLTRPNESGASVNGTLDREFERTVWDGVHKVLSQRGIAARLQQSESDDEAAAAYAVDPTISGVILLGGLVQQAFAQALIRERAPFVVVGSHLHPFAVNAVMADVVHGMAAAARAVIATGRRRIGLINGPTETRTSAEKREGLLLALSETGIPFNPDHVITSHFNPDHGYLSTQTLLAAAPDVDAILYADDTMALGGIKALRESGRRIPDDVAIVGFGDYGLAQYTDPPLASVRFDMQAMGRIAARRLCMLIDEEGDDDAWLVRVPCLLVMRSSLA